MNASVQNQPNRGRFAGVLQIARYNWPQYVLALLMILSTSAWLWLGRDNLNWLRALASIAAALAGWWCLASLAASYWIYDRSSLYRWTWIPSILPTNPKRWLNLHAGLDESSGALRQLLRDSTGQILDFYDASEMPEPSIRRARIEQGNSPCATVDYRHLTYADGTVDAVFLLFVAHELRRASSRELFFCEVARILAPKGSVLLVEHVRDLANFAAFGPGFLHFLPGSEWQRLASVSGLKVVKALRMTPFVKVMLLRRQP